MTCTTYMFRNTEKLASLIYRQTISRCVPRLPLKKEALHLSSFSGFNAATTFVFQKIPHLGQKHSPGFSLAQHPCLSCPEEGPLFKLSN